jgi:hypothetical protein
MRQDFAVLAIALLQKVGDELAATVGYGRAGNSHALCPREVSLSRRAAISEVFEKPN